MPYLTMFSVHIYKCIKILLCNILWKNNESVNINSIVSQDSQAKATGTFHNEFFK